jgi:diphthine-ammonia ligase
VGQDAIEFVARALDVPLYRRVISGSALAQGSEYGGRNAEDRGGVAGDETEDLYALLADVKVMQILSDASPLPHLSVEYTAVPTS